MAHLFLLWKKHGSQDNILGIISDENLPRFAVVLLMLSTFSVCELCRNGQSLGEAFTDVRVGQGFAYFPAVSLSIHENVRANFGSTPLHYTLPGYRPLQAPPTIDLIRSRLLLSYFERLVPIMASCCVPKVKRFFSCHLFTIERVKELIAIKKINAVKRINAPTYIL